MFDVLVCGSLHLDTVVRGRLPAPDETVMGEGVAYACGGKGGNQAVAAARAGARTAMIGRVGDDDAGRTLTANLEQHGVDVSGVAVGAEPSGMSVAIVDEAGDYGAVVVSGANRAIVIGAVPEANVLVLQNEVPQAVNEAVIAHSDAFTIWNAAPTRDGALVADLLVVNRVEASTMLGAPIETAHGAVAALEAGRSPAPLTCITLGAGGAVIGGGARTLHVPAPKVDVVSSHGAGDCFVGALAAAIARGTAPFDAVVPAVEAAARFVAAARAT